MKALEGKRVSFQGYAVIQPVPDGGRFLTRRPHERLHPDDAESLPWDAIGLLRRRGLSMPAVPKRPTVEGTPRLGSRSLGERAGPAATSHDAAQPSRRTSENLRRPSARGR